MLHWRRNWTEVTFVIIFNQFLPTKLNQMIHNSEQKPHVLRVTAETQQNDGIIQRARRFWPPWTHELKHHQL